ncbi:cell division protein FtsZ [Rickettsia typhi]|uniref:Cell division protein FtsZ n=2 Tax=Rickettsia typhi TaxID=785 RepID=FTSZ_RICTY|nr:cell division protein FtsZ [Rickettsia typhi]Q68W73.1 RecName: Full=Cell division protein FtsZ [Rickettsia typhi str. Wilmington]AAU04119.1 cell division protein FtsZ [Rickettsia typhi str. Wilmington]AFE54498.1 cell division protein FtsZ [Rickettsia typhi str. TH1527]AFE55337.1 cell division protein FtsZ [Rickettsia typhi str. B9991CWPP]
MILNIKAPENIVLKPTITVFGVGGAGSNAVNNMIHANLQGANFVVANTDAQSLEHSLCINKIQLGVSTTRGLGAGASPEVGALAAQESENEIRSSLENSNMVFITAGMGGGTGTGSAPIIARIAKELGILTVGVVTKPFHFEGGHRMKTADKGLIELQQFVDTLIVIPNQNLFRIANEQTTFADAFKMADDVLHAGVRGVTDLMIMPGLINLDFADIKAVMSEMGKAMMGTGEDSGEDRAIKAAESAISNPLLDHSSMCGARGVLINITGGPDMTLFEVDNAANRIREEVDNIDANIIFGSTFNPELKGIIRVSVVATGIDADKVPKYKLAIDENTNTVPKETYNESMIQHTQIEEIPAFNNYSTENIEITDSSIKQNYTENEQELRLHVNAVNKPENNSQKSSFLWKIWGSLRASNNQTLERKNVIVNTLDQDNKESDIHDIPAFLRKKRD